MPLNDDLRTPQTRRVDNPIHDTQSFADSDLPVRDTAQLPIRRVRKQVLRACDWCRARRIRCDNGQPCRSCLRRDALCTREEHESEVPKTFKQALREIKKLKLRIKELEAAAVRVVSAPRPGPDSESRSRSDQPSNPPSPVVDPHLRLPLCAPPEKLSTPSTAKPQWEGMQIATARSGRTSYYGPTSSIYFMSCIGIYISRALQQPFMARSIQPLGLRRINPGSAVGGAVDDVVGSSATTSAVDGSSGPLTRAQEEMVLRLFWECYHALLPIVDEVELRRHFASLWQSSGQYRNQSPLIDIILALCLQYGYRMFPNQLQMAAPSGAHESDVPIDAADAGRWYYRRSQATLTNELESPTITTVQCYVFTAKYLCCASLYNTGHIITAQALRTAQVLGLHLEPPSDLPHGERELRKRVWWALWATDAVTSFKHGRPFFVVGPYAGVMLPSDDIDAASYNGAALGSYGPQVTWLTYSIQLYKLVLLMVEVHNLLYAKVGEVISQGNLKHLDREPEALDSCAKVLTDKLPALRSWAEYVPTGMKSRRRDGGEPFSTDLSPVEIEACAPMWLQRQRICLELMYHTIVINLSRPFITFHSNPEIHTPVVKCLSTTCVDHAIAYTLLMHQAVTESEIMSGWSDYFGLQWNAAITLIGFILAYPAHVATTKARQALIRAIAVFDIYGVKFAVSADAATIMRELASKADLLVGRLNNRTTSDTAGTVTQGGGNLVSVNNAVQAAGDNDGLAWLDYGSHDDDQFSQFMDWALLVDSFNG